MRWVRDRTGPHGRVGRSQLVRPVETCETAQSLLGPPTSERVNASAFTAGRSLTGRRQIILNKFSKVTKHTVEIYKFTRAIMSGNGSSATVTAVRVMARFRPLNSQELKRQQHAPY